MIPAFNTTLALPEAAAAAGRAPGVTAPAGAPQGPQSFAAQMQSLETIDSSGVPGPLPLPQAVTGQLDPVRAVNALLAVSAGPAAIPAALPAGQPAVALLESVPTGDLPDGTILPRTGNELPPDDLPPLRVSAEIETLAPGVNPLVPQPDARLAQAPVEPITEGVSVVPKTGQPAVDRRFADPGGTDPALTDADLPPVQSGRTAAANGSAVETDPQRGEFVQKLATQNAGQAEPVMSLRTSAVPAEFSTVMTDPVSPILVQQSGSPAMFADSLTDLSQLQNMRPLQPAADQRVFTEGLNQRLMLMAEDGVQSARLKLHPENLGALDVRIQVEDDTARVWFTAQHGMVRDALESALPRLREMFTQQGMNLVQADVGADHGDSRTGREFEPAADTLAGPTLADPVPGDDSHLATGAGHVTMRALDIYV